MPKVQCQKDPKEIQIQIENRRLYVNLHLQTRRLKFAYMDDENNALKLIIQLCLKDYPRLEYPRLEVTVYSLLENLFYFSFFFPLLFRRL